jgi:phage gp36-like protein
MARFLQANDYAMQVKSEIIKILTSNDAEWFNSAALIRAENTAISQIKNRIGKRYDCTQVFAPAETTDERDQWIVTITIDLALYHLYSKTGSKDVPQHRQDRYQDAIDWLKDVGNGDTTADLPQIIDANTGEAFSEFRLSSRTPENQKW